jgi:hypothetical protein
MSRKQAFFERLENFEKIRENLKNLEHFWKFGNFEVTLAHVM